MKRIAIGFLAVSWAIQALACVPGEPHVTITGALYTCDTSRPGLHEAYRDSTGLIWGAPSPVSGFTHTEAKAYCEDVGARLPTKDEFDRLRRELGYCDTRSPGCSENLYSPFVRGSRKIEVLPEISYGYYWSSTVYEYDPSQMYMLWYFWLTQAKPEFRYYLNGGTRVRCVQEAK